MERLRWFALVPLVALLQASATAQETEDCERITLAQMPVRGTFTAEHHERFYCVSAHRGQHMKITMGKTPDLDLQCNVYFPRGNLSPGASTAAPVPCFDEQLPDDGLYRIRIGQRFGGKKPGRFEFTIELK